MTGFVPTASAPTAAQSVLLPRTRLVNITDEESPAQAHVASSPNSVVLADEQNETEI